MLLDPEQYYRATGLWNGMDAAVGKDQPAFFKSTFLSRGLIADRIRSRQFPDRGVRFIALLDTP